MQLLETILFNILIRLQHLSKRKAEAWNKKYQYTTEEEEKSYSAAESERKLWPSKATMWLSCWKIWSAFYDMKCLWRINSEESQCRLILKKWRETEMKMLSISEEMAILSKTAAKKLSAAYRRNKLAENICIEARNISQLAHRNGEWEMYENEAVEIMAMAVEMWNETVEDHVKRQFCGRTTSKKVKWRRPEMKKKMKKYDETLKEARRKAAAKRGVLQRS